MSSHGRHHAGLARSGNKADPTTGPTTDRRSARSRMIAIVTHGGSGDAGASGGDAGLYLAHFATGSGSRAFPKTTAPAPPYHKFPRDLGFMGTLPLTASPAITEASSSAAPPPDDASRAAAGEACDFIPLGVLGQVETDGPALITDPLSAVVGGASSPRSTLPRPGMDERPGVIEIDLADGTRLRVDAFVNERALRRVMAALKAAS
jgi:hypothetical protein